MSITAGRKIAADRPFPGIPMANERLRPLLRELTWYEQNLMCDLGKSVVHAVEATARNFAQGQTEEEVAGQLAHRLLHRRIEPVIISITADDRGAKYRRAGFGPYPITRNCVIQVTGLRDGLYATCSRTICFESPSDEFRTAHDFAVKQAALFRSLTRPNVTIGAIGEAGRTILTGTPFEYEWRLSQSGFGTGRFAAEEFRRAGVEDPLVPGHAIVWQPHIGAAAVVDTVIVTETEPVAVTPPEEWPVKRLAVRGGPYYDIPDILIRDDE
jgi:Xaa-Pro aminopeptidase